MKKLAPFWATYVTKEMMRTFRSELVEPGVFKLPFPQCGKIRDYDGFSVDDDVCSKPGPEERYKRLRDDRKNAADQYPASILDRMCRVNRAASCVQTCQFIVYSKLLAHLIKDCRPIKRSDLK